jgi:hypothetical protein
MIRGDKFSPRPGDALFKSNKLIDEFANKLATGPVAAVPGGARERVPRKRNPDRLAKAFDSTFNRAIDFQREHKFGVYGKARLGNTFQMEAQGLGLPDDFIEIATKSLVNFLAVQRNR